MTTLLTPGRMTGPVHLENHVMAEWRKKSRKRIYQTDPVAWLNDVLGKRWWSKQEEIAWSVVENVFTIVKSCNGVGKTALAGDLVTWWISVFEPVETTALVSAPVRNQIDENLFGYLRANYNVALERNQPLDGEITRWPKWVIHEPYEHDLVLPKRPADQNLLSSFQGIHRDNVLVVLDEAGGLQDEFFIAANAVTTNEHARIFAIGNPDIPNTAFHQRFKSASIADTPLEREPTAEEIEIDAVYQDGHGQWHKFGDPFRDWNRFTIGAKDSPNFTGEDIYPENPELDKKIKSRLVQVSWANMMRRSASVGVVKAKVDGEFPDEADNTFFIQTVINKGWETFGLMTEIGMSATARKTLGVDVAFSGEDKNVVYLNTGGRIVKIDQWDKGSDGEASVEDMAIARRVHRLAIEHNVDEVRIDATGTSRGPHSNLKTEKEFHNGNYVLIGVIGSNASPDKNKWLNARAWHYDKFRENLANGSIGIDPGDADLRTDLEVQTYKYTVRKQLQIDSKEIIKKELKHSPDHLDAAIYSAIDYSAVVDDPANGLAPGDMVTEDPWEMLDIDGYAGLPI